MRLAEQYKQAAEALAGDGERGRIRKERKIAAESFWEYCKFINGRFFREDQPHLKRIADTLQAIYERQVYKVSPEELEWRRAADPEELEAVRQAHPDCIVCRKMMLNVPPRHGKSYTVSLFVQWVLGKSAENRVIAVTYNEILAGRFSVNVRDGIDATKLDEKLHIFSDVFPDTKIKAGDGSKQVWSLEGQFFNYLAAGFGGTITGIGCNIGIIDDPIKSDKEAFNDRILQEQWTWYTDTFLSRVEEGGLQIVIMTRWSTRDLCGRLLSSPEGPEWLVLEMQACLDEEKGLMLCPGLLSFESYRKKKGLTSTAIMEANYQQRPIDIQGGLYTHFSTYEELPQNERGELVYDAIKAYVDTADTGEDYLCAIAYRTYMEEDYVVDVIYTQESMEQTEYAVAAMLYYTGCTEADIESNNGGRGFARNVERILRDTFHSTRCVIRPFTQTQNKESRIRSAATWVMEHIYYPVNWMHKWPEYFLAMKTYKARGKNDHDDAQDATTGVAEKSGFGENDTWLY